MTPAEIATLIEQTQERLTAYIAAEQHILQGGQAYSISGANGSRSLTKGDLGEIRKAIIDLNNQLNTLNSGNKFKIQTVVPRT